MGLFHNHHKKCYEHNCFLQFWTHASLTLHFLFLFDYLSWVLSWFMRNIYPLSKNCLNFLFPKFQTIFCPSSKLQIFLLLPIFLLSQLILPPPLQRDYPTFPLNFLSYLFPDLNQRSLLSYQQFQSLLSSSLSHEELGGQNCWTG